MEENKTDKSKIRFLIVVIVVVSILIVGFVFIAVIDMTKKESVNRVSTTTRRTITTTQGEVEEPTTEDPNNVTEPTTEPTIEPPETTTTVSTTKTTVVRPSNSTSTRTSKAPTISTSPSVIPSYDREETTSPTDYPGALDSWEWEVVNMINSERKKRGLKELKVSKELRELAESAADQWIVLGDVGVKEYLSGNSNYRMYSNLEISPKTLYNNTVSSTKILTNQYLDYVGVGVIEKNTGLTTYFYVIIYE